jgi:hypothetical protein
VKEIQVNARKGNFKLSRAGRNAGEDKFRLRVLRAIRFSALET